MDRIRLHLRHVPEPCAPHEKPDPDDDPTASGRGMEGGEAELRSELTGPNSDTTRNAAESHGSVAVAFARPWS